MAHYAIYPPQQMSADTVNVKSHCPITVYFLMEEVNFGPLQKTCNLQIISMAFQQGCGN